MWKPCITISAIQPRKIQDNSIEGRPVPACHRREVLMRNVHEVLQQKELDLTRVRQEVEALRCVAPMLTEPRGNQMAVSDSELRQKNRWPLQIEELPPESFG